MKIGSRLASCVAVAALLVTTVAAAQSSLLMTGTYRCSAFNVSGGGGSCRTMPPLMLNPDGSYQFSSTNGRWSVQNGQLVLSESRLWGPGTIVTRNTIRFEYDYAGLRQVITWICEGCSSNAAPAGGGERVAGSAVGVSLTLQFNTRVTGFTGFVVLPAESARDYQQNAPLPKGGIIGLAWELNSTSVALGTNRNQHLMTGRQYVVFLEWPRELRPVAILDLPDLNEDYTATLRGTLDGQSVLSQIGRRSQVSSPVAPTATPPTASPSRPSAGTSASPSLGVEVGHLEGMSVIQVQSGSPADLAGIQAGDVITAVNGIRVRSGDEMKEMLDRRKPGEATQIHLFRAGKVITVRVE